MSRPVSTILLATLLATGSPRRASAKYTDMSGNLPGIVSTGTVVGAGAGAAAAIGLLIYYEVHHKGIVKLDPAAGSTRFTGLAPATPVSETVVITNPTGKNVSIESITLDASPAFSLGPLPSFPVRLAPGDTPLHIPVTVTANGPSGSTHIRVTAREVNPDTHKEKKAVEKSFTVSYTQKKEGEKKKKLPGVIP
jgi:hypothetical protein